MNHPRTRDYHPRSVDDWKFQFIEKYTVSSKIIHGDLNHPYLPLKIIHGYPDHYAKWIQNDAKCHPNAPKRTPGGFQMDQEASRWLKRCQDGLKEAPRCPPRTPKMAQRGPKMARRDPKMVPKGPKMAPRWSQEASKGTMLAPCGINCMA